MNLFILKRPGFFPLTPDPYSYYTENPGNRGDPRRAYENAEPDRDKKNEASSSLMTP
jgi:hypothetical protein